MNLLLQSNEMGSFAEAWPMIKRSAGFRSFLRDHEIPITKIPKSRVPALVNEYFKTMVLPQYQGRELLNNQELSLYDALATHGVKVGANGARETLEALSANNRKRIEEGAPEVDAEVQREIGDSIASLQVFPAHNTHHIDSLQSDMPLVSSKDIRSIGLRGGLNSQEAFNRQFMESEDQVFFHATVARTARGAVENRTIYGEHGLVLKGAYAKDHAWVSPFIMYTENLAAFGKVCCPKEAAKVGEGTWDMIRRGKSEEAPVEELMAALAIKNRLGQYDFTVGDYEGMVRNLLVRSLSAEKARDPEAYRQSIEALKSDNPTVLYGLIKEKVFDTYGLPESFEVKVPVAVPRSAIVPVPSRGLAKRPVAPKQ